MLSPWVPGPWPGPWSLVGTTTHSADAAGRAEVRAVETLAEFPAALPVLRWLTRSMSDLEAFLSPTDSRLWRIGGAGRRIVTGDRVPSAAGAMYARKLMVEAIALGFFLYGWNKMNKWVHFYMGILVGISGVASGILVVAANGWMNSPSGFDWVNGQAINIDPVAAMFNDAWLSQAIHMTIAAFLSTGIAVAGLHALLLIRKPDNIFHQKAIRIAMVFTLFAAILQPISGDFSAKDVAKRQPIKLAAMEAHFETAAPADLVVGGIPDEKEGKVNYAIHLPGFLSFLAYGNFNAEVKGLNEFPRENWPPVLITHIAFQIMVGIGMLLLLREGKGTPPTSAVDRRDAVRVGRDGIAGERPAAGDDGEGDGGGRQLRSRRRARCCPPRK